MIYYIYFINHISHLVVAVGVKVVAAGVGAVAMIIKLQPSIALNIEITLRT